MARVVVFSMSDFSRDPRVYRQLEALSKVHEVIPVGFRPSLEKYPEGVDLEPFFLPRVDGRNKVEKLVRLLQRRSFSNVFLLLAKRFLSLLPLGLRGRIFVQRFITDRKVINILKSIHCDLLIGNDLSGLMPVVEAKGNRRVLYDAHEYSPGQIGGKKAEQRKRYSTAVLKRYLPRCDSMITVCDGIAEEYKREFRIPRPDVILNAPGFEELTPIFRNDGKIRLVHHGVASRQRMLEIMIDTMSILGNQFELDFFLINEGSAYFKELKHRARANERIKFYPPISMNELSLRLNIYDIGFYILPPSSFNHLHSLPNKFFEFIQGRLGVAIGPSPEMANLVRKYELGVISEDFTAESMARSLASITQEDIRRFKNNSHRWAYELSAEPQMEKLRTIVSQTLKTR